jgi:hypothetical protein
MTYQASDGRRPILGPCPCRVCGEPLWWAKRMSRYLTINALRVGWREQGGRLHRCAQIRQKLAADTRPRYGPKGPRRRNPDTVCPYCLNTINARRMRDHLVVAHPEPVS